MTSTTEHEPALDEDLFRDCARRLSNAKDSSWQQRWKLAAGGGFLRLMMPVHHGGQGASARAMVDAMVMLGEECADNGLTLGLNSQIWTIQQTLLRFGSDAQARRYLPALMNGDSTGAYALTEAGSGSDALALETRAEPSGDGYVLNGSKTLIGMAPVCDMAIVFASTAPDRGSWGISAFVVEASDRGFLRDQAQDKIGLKTLPMGEMRFEDCHIPEDRRLGPEGAGAQIIRETLDWERGFILAPHVGAMERQLAESVDQVKSRRVFGQPIGDFQSVSNRIADMRVRLETSRLMLHRMAQMYEDGDALSGQAAITNLTISEAFLASSLDAFRNLGGVGYLSELEAGGNVLDAMGGVIYSGTSDVQRQIIARLEMQRASRSGFAAPSAEDAKGT